MSLHINKCYKVKEISRKQNKNTDGKYQRKDEKNQRINLGDL